MKNSVLIALLTTMVSTPLLSDGHSGITFPESSQWVARGIISAVNDDGTFSIDGYEHIFTLSSTEFSEQFDVDSLLGLNISCFSASRQGGKILPPVASSPVRSICQFLGVPGNPSLADYFIAEGQAVRTCNSNFPFCKE